MKLETLEDYYLKELRDLYDAEKQLLKALPRMAKAASHEELRSAFTEHAEQTQEQLDRLDEVLKNHGQNGRGRKCKAMMGLIDEGKDMMAERPNREIMDVGLITTAQKIEHYEIAGYGSMSTYAKMLGLRDDLKLLQQTLTEEKETDSRLTRLAKSVVNPRAREHTEEEEEAEPRRGGQERSMARAAGRTSQRSASGKRSGSSRTASKESVPSRSGDQKASGGAKPTKDLEEIGEWAEARGGKPARVCGTGTGSDPGILRIDFPGYSGEGSLEHISWEEWYEKFKENNLTFIYQDKTKAGKESRFFKLVCLEGAEA